MSVNAVDAGTSILSDVYVQMIRFSDDLKVGTTYPLISSDGSLFSTDYAVSSELSLDTTYYIEITAVDGFGNSSVVTYPSYQFKPIQATYLNPSPYVVSTVKTETLTIADLRSNGITVIPTGMPGTLNDVIYGVVSFSNELDSCSLDPSNGQGDPQKLEITAEAQGTGYCTITLELDGTTNTQTVKVNIQETPDTLLSTFRIAPALDPLFPGVPKCERKGKFHRFCGI